LNSYPAEINSKEEIKHPVRGRLIDIFITYNSNSGNEVVLQRWPSKTLSSCSEFLKASESNNTYNSIIQVESPRVPSVNYCQECVSASRNQTSLLQSEIFDGPDPVTPFSTPCLSDSPSSNQSSNLSPSVKFQIGPIRIKGCHPTQYETANGLCVCKEGFKRSSKKSSDSGTNYECTPCSNGEFRTAEDPELPTSFQDTSCVSCPSNMEISNQNDRTAFENCRCVSKDSDSNGYYFVYNVNENSLKRGQCPYEELRLVGFADWASGAVASGSKKPLCECKPCQENAVCQNGTLTPKDGYWLLTVNDIQNERSWQTYEKDKMQLQQQGIDHAVSADVLIKCSSSLACTGGKCNDALGYSGYLCTKCKEGWGKSAGSLCAPCPNPAWVASFLAFLIGTGILGIIYMLAQSSKRPKSELSALTKILLNHFQLLSFIANVKNKWTTLFAYIFAPASALTNGIEIPFVDCALKEQSFGIKYFLAMGLPFIGIIVPVLGEIIYFLLNRFFTKTTDVEFLDQHLRQQLTVFPKWHRKSLTSALTFRAATLSTEKWLQLTANITIMTFIVLYLGYAAICQAALLVLKSESRKYAESDDDMLLVSERMEADVEISTSSTEYRYLYQPAALVFLLTYGVSIPGILLYNMYKRRHRLFEGDRTTEIYGFMIQGYAYNRYWWEIVVMIRKLLVSAVVVFLAQNTTNQSFALILVTDVAIVLGIYTKPFRSNIAQAFETFSLSVIHLTLMAGLLLDTDLTVSYSPYTQELKDNVVSLIALGLNAVVIISILGTFAWDFLKERSLIEMLEGTFMYRKIQAVRQPQKMFRNPADLFQYHNVMSLADFKQRSGGVILFQKKLSNRSSGSLSSVSTTSSKVSSVDIEKGNLRNKSKLSHRVPIIEEDMVFDLVLDAPSSSNVAQIYSDVQLWGIERVPTIDTQAVPKLDLTGFDSDSSVSSVEADFTSHYVSELSLPILPTTITMDSNENCTSQTGIDLVVKGSNSKVLEQEFLVSNNSLLDSSDSESITNDSNGSEGSSFDENNDIEISDFHDEHFAASVSPLTIEALVPS
jgi:hypothetical protein